MTETSSNTSLREQLDAALADVIAAEHALDDLLRELRVRARAEKTTISAAVHDAFVRVRKARAVVAGVRDLMPR